MLKFSKLNRFEFQSFDIVSNFAFRASNFRISELRQSCEVAAVGIEPTTLGL